MTITMGYGMLFVRTYESDRSTFALPDKHFRHGAVPEKQER